MKACEHKELQRSRRKAWERLGVLLRLRPYRCTLCHKRVWRYCGHWPLDLSVVVAVVVALLLYVLMLAPPGNDELGVVALPSATLEPWPPVPARVEERSVVVAAISASMSSPVPLATPTPVARATPTPRPVNTPVPTSTIAPAPAAVAANPGRARVTTLENRSSADRFHMVIRHSRGEIEPLLNRLADPPRLILDLPGRWAMDKALPRSLDLDNAQVRRVRVGDHTDKLRVVIDLAETEGLRHTLVVRHGAVELVLLSR